MQEWSHKFQAEVAVVVMVVVVVTTSGCALFSCDFQVCIRFQLRLVSQ